MALYLYSLEDWTTATSGDNVVRRYNSDAGNWVSSLASPPFVGKVTSTSTLRQQGGWDGNRWYVISPTGGLYAYSPSANTWSSILASGTALFASAEDQRWCMCSDGRYLYILSSGFDFRRYDPTNDSLTLLQANPGSTYAARMFLVYDLSGSIYGYKGDTSAQIYKYSIANDTWTALPTQATMVSDSMGSSSFSCFLQGKLWVLYNLTNITLKAFAYNPSTNTWAAGAASGATYNGNEATPYQEENDHTIRLWNGSGGSSFSYNIIASTFTPVFALPWNPTQGQNWSVARNMQAAFIWYESDGVTPLSVNRSAGSLAVGQTVTIQAKVKTIAARAAGVTVSVVPNAQSDAEDAVSICATSGGTYTQSFSTGALSAGDFFDVFIKFVPTIVQSIGLAKDLNLQVFGN